MLRIVPPVEVLWDTTPSPVQSSCSASIVLAVDGQAYIRTNGKPNNIPQSKFQNRATLPQLESKYDEGPLHHHTEQRVHHSRDVFRVSPALVPQYFSEAMSLLAIFHAHTYSDDPDDELRWEFLHCDKVKTGADSAARPVLDPDSEVFVWPGGGHL